MQKLQDVGYRSMRIVNSTDMTSNLIDPETNETLTTVPGKLVEMTYSSNFAPDEMRRGYFILAAANETVPNVGTTKGYSVFYEGNSTTTTPAEITTAAASLPLSPAVGEVLDSFELIAAPEVAQALAETAEDDDDDEEDNGAEEEDDDNGGGDDDEEDDDNGGGDDDEEDEEKGGEKDEEEDEENGGGDDDEEDDDNGGGDDDEEDDDNGGGDDDGAGDDDNGGGDDDGAGDNDEGSGIFDQGTSSRGRPADDYDADAEGE